MSSTSTSLSNTLFLIQQQTFRYIYSIYLSLGVVGCCLNILLLSRRQFRTISCCIYFLGMSITILIHIIFCLSLSLYALDHVDPTTSIVAFCKMRIYVLQSTSMMYRWCLTSACFDRYTCSSTYLHLREFAKVYIARRIVVIIIIVWLVLPIHTLIYYNLQAGRCGILDNTAASYYHSIFTTITGSVLPVLIMSTCAILIHRNLAFIRQSRQFTIQENRRKILQRKRDQQILVMLLTQTLVYLVLITPLMGLYFYNAAAINIPNKSVNRLAIERFALYISELILITFPVSSFYLYTMTSRMFRNELKNMLRSAFDCKRLLRHIRRVEPIANDIELGGVTRRRIILKSVSQSLVPVGSRFACSIKPIEQQGNTNQDIKH